METIRCPVTTEYSSASAALRAWKSVMSDVWAEHSPSFVSIYKRVSILSNDMGEREIRFIDE